MDFVDLTMILWHAVWPTMKSQDWARLWQSTGDLVYFRAYIRSCWAETA